MGGEPATFPTMPPTPVPDPNRCITLRIRPDLWPEDISWKLYDKADQILVEGDMDPRLDKTVDVFTYCFPQLSDGCWRLKMIDNMHNGLCCSQGYGYYEIYWGTTQNKRRKRIHNSKFRDGKEKHQGHMELSKGCGEYTNCVTNTTTGDPCLFPFIDNGRTYTD